MSVLAPSVAAEVVAQCQSGRDEIAGALTRALDRKIDVKVAAVAPMDEARRATLAGPGLAVVLTVGDRAAVVALSESTGLLPGWYANPDATGKSKLTTLAQELGMLVLPSELIADDFGAGRVESIAAALAAGKLTADAQVLPLVLSGDGAAGEALLIWPVAEPRAVLTAVAPAVGGSASAGAPGAQKTAAPVAAPNPAAPAAAPTMRFPKRLPNYTKSLLRIRVPVTVTLAAKRQPVSQILELGPGSILHFDKPCEEMLDLSAGDHKIAKGEAVKVGDKFGLRITSIVLPDERFKPVRGASA